MFSSFHKRICTHYANCHYQSNSTLVILCKKGEQNPVAVRHGSTTILDFDLAPLRRHVI
jgi:hypothetical protein